MGNLVFTERAWEEYLNWQAAFRNVEPADR